LAKARDIRSLIGCPLAHAARWLNLEKLGMIECGSPTLTATFPVQASATTPVQ
jgi:hypothetical protein